MYGRACAPVFIESGAIRSSGLRRGRVSRTTIFSRSRNRRMALCGSDPGSASAVIAAGRFQLTPRQTVSLTAPFCLSVWIAKAVCGPARKRGWISLRTAPVTPYTRREGLPGNDTSAILQDTAGNLWVGTLNEGPGQVRRQELSLDHVPRRSCQQPRIEPGARCLGRYLGGNRQWNQPHSRRGAFWKRFGSRFTRKRPPSLSITAARSGRAREKDCSGTTAAGSNRPAKAPARSRLSAVDCRRGSSSARRARDSFTLRAIR